MHSLTVVVEAQLSAHHPTVLKPEAIMTDSTPYSVKAHLQSTGIVVGAVNQPEIAMGTLSYSETNIVSLEEKVRNNNKVYLNLIRREKCVHENAYDLKMFIIC